MSVHELMKNKVKHPVFWACLIFMCFCFFWLLALGLTSYDGDEWRTLPLPDKSVFESILYSFKGGKRVILPSILIPIIQVFGHNSVFIDIVILVLHIVSVILSAIFFSAFIKDRFFITIYVLLLFFWPGTMVTISINYSIVFSFSPICVWLSLLVAQRWIISQNRIILLALIGLLYCLSLLTYENMLFYSVPAILFIMLHYNHLDISPKRYWKTFKGILLGYGLGYLGFMLVRLLMPIGLHSSVTSNISPIYIVNQIIDYLIILPQYMLPTSHMNVDLFSIIVATCLSIATFLLLSHSYTTSVRNNSKYLMLQVMIVAGIAICAGIGPYIIAGYGATLAMSASSRIFSSAIFGFVLILSCILTLLSSYHRIIRYVIITMISLWIVYCTVLFLDFASEEHQSSELRDAVYTEIIRLVPDVQSNTTLLLVHFEDALSGVLGTNEMARIFYDETINARFIYGEDQDPGEFRLAHVYSDHVIARYNTEVSSENIILLEYTENGIVLRESISKDEPWLIEWHDNTDILYSNLNRVIDDKGENFRRLSNLRLINLSG